VIVAVGADVFGKVAKAAIWNQHSLDDAQVQAGLQASPARRINAKKTLGAGSDARVANVLEVVQVRLLEKNGYGVACSKVVLDVCEVPAVFDAGSDELPTFVEERVAEQVVGQVTESHGGFVADTQLALVHVVQECREGVERRSLELERRRASVAFGKGHTSAAGEQLSKVVRLARPYAQNGLVGIELRPIPTRHGDYQPVPERRLRIRAPAERPGLHSRAPSDQRILAAASALHGGRRRRRARPGSSRR